MKQKNVTAGPNDQLPPKLQRTRSQRILASIKKNYWLYLFILPTLIWLLIFCYGPMGGIVIAFKRYTGVQSIMDSPWVGLKWFKSFFSSHYFPRVMGNTIRLALYNLITFPLPIIFALLLNEIKNQRFKSAVQTIMYAPHFISIVVLVGMINLFFSSTGIVNVLIQKFGGETHNFLANDAAFPHLYIWSGVWQQLGWNCIIYVAALSNVSPDLHEAAILDGATHFQRAIHINLPAIMPTVMIMLIMNVGSMLSIGTQKILLMKNDLNRATAEVIDTFVYERGLLGGDYSYATAVGLFVNVVNMVLLFGANYISKKTTDNSLF